MDPGEDEVELDPDALPGFLTRKDAAQLRAWRRELERDGREVSWSEAIGLACKAGLAQRAAAASPSSEAKEGASEPANSETARRSLAPRPVPAPQTVLHGPRCGVCGPGVLLQGGVELGRPRGAARAERNAALLAGAREAAEGVPVTRWVPVAVERWILARSRGRCEVPGCTNEYFMHVHHNRGWPDGHDPDHLVHLCSLHHQAVHQGRLKIYGCWSDGIRFQLADGTLLGERGGPPSGAEAPSGGGGNSAAQHAAEEEAPPAGLRETPPEADDPRIRSDDRSGGQGPADRPTDADRAAERDSGAPAADTLTRAQAVQALTKLQLPVRHARALVGQPLQDQPDLLDRPAGEVLGALLHRLPEPGGR